jgi:hypothetical protein
MEITEVFNSFLSDFIDPKKTNISGLSNPIFGNSLLMVGSNP